MVFRFHLFLSLTPNHYMRKVFLSALVLLGSVAPALSQDSPVRFNSTIVSKTVSNSTRRACGTMEVLAAQLAADPA